MARDWQTLRAEFRALLRPGAPRSPLAAGSAAQRFEVRVCANGGTWEVRPGIDGPVHLHPNAMVALHQAHEIARRTWEDEGRLSAVRLLSPAGRWELDMVFGASL